MPRSSRGDLVPPQRSAKSARLPPPSYCRPRSRGWRARPRARPQQRRQGRAGSSQRKRRRPGSTLRKQLK
eukprot:3511677-Pyramimonas_sp.AAC.1